MTKDFLLSLIVPVYNEENNVELLLKKLVPIVKNERHEIIFIDDGSSDTTPSIIKKQTSENKNIRLISFYRNFGHQMAIAAGYKNAKGDCVISLDADLQDPPDIIPEMLAKWKNGSDIVYAKRQKRDGDSFFKRITASAFYRLVNFLSDTPIPEEVGDFRLLDRKVVDFLNSRTEEPQFIRGLVAWGGFKTDYVLFHRGRRNAGITHYPLSRMINFALSGITSFSTKPLRLATYLGFIAAIIGFFGIIYAVLGKIFLPREWITGWTALFVGIMFLGGIQLITIGIIGEYVGKIYKEVQKRPPYIVKEKINI